MHQESNINSSIPSVVSQQQVVHSEFLKIGNSTPHKLMQP